MKPYKPDGLPLETIDWVELIELMSEANRKIARYDGLLRSIVNPDVLLSPLKTKESVLSSKIEGTQATLQEVLAFDASQKTEEHASGDIQEIINYRQALQLGRQSMEERPLTLNVIRSIHKLLLSNVRGQSKDPGNFRRIQNWIGAVGSTMDTARFVPPSVPDMHKALDNWEKYIHADEKDPIVQLAIIHAQFEIIHPFIDGNGRIGRILIPLFLYHKEIVHQPIFYMSEYLESNRELYYDHLKDITDNKNWTGWITFFLRGFITQSEKNSNQTKAIIDLYEVTKNIIVEKTKSQFAIQCLDFIFANPIFTSTKFHNTSGIPRSSTSRLVKSLEETELIKCIEKGVGRRPSFYIFEELLHIVNR